MSLQEIHAHDISAIYPKAYLPDRMSSFGIRS